MFLVVQRVRSSSGEEGINRFAYLAGEQDWNEPRSVLDTEPTTLLQATTPVPAGGNHVRSYLDVVFPDDYTREQISWILTTIPRVDEIDELPYESSLGQAAWRFNAVSELVPFREGELEILSDEAHNLAISWLDTIETSPPSRMSATERTSLVLEASGGNTGAAIEFLRALAAGDRLEAMVEAIEVYADSVGVQGPGVRAFLWGRVPGILSNNYFNTLGPRRYNRFIEWSLRNPGWGDGLRAAAAQSGDALRTATRQVLAAAGAN